MRIRLDIELVNLDHTGRGRERLRHVHPQLRVPFDPTDSPTVSHDAPLKVSKTDYTEQNSICQLLFQELRYSINPILTDSSI